MEGEYHGQGSYCWPDGAMYIGPFTHNRCLYVHTHAHTRTHSCTQHAHTCTHTFCPVLLFSCRYCHTTPVRGSEGNGWMMEMTWIMLNVRFTSVDSQPSTAEEPSLTCSALNCATLFLYRSLSLSYTFMSGSVACSPEPAQAFLALNLFILLGGILPRTSCSGVRSAGVWGISRATSMDYSTSLAAEPPAAGRALYCCTLLTDWSLAFHDTLVSSSISLSAEAPPTLLAVHLVLWLSEHLLLAVMLTKPLAIDGTTTGPVGGFLIPIFL